VDQGAIQGATWRKWRVAGFVGRYEHSLDTKGRVILPAKFRAAFEHGGYLTENREGCLALWTPGEFERQMAGMQERAVAGRANRNRARLWAATSHEVEIDRQGRMAIPVHLREFAALGGDVLVHGAIDRVELWDPGAWEERVRPDERWLLLDEDEDG
jgi:MraZ protein